MSFESTHTKAILKAFFASMIFFSIISPTYAYTNITDYINNFSSTIRLVLDMQNKPINTSSIDPNNPSTNTHNDNTNELLSRFCTTILNKDFALNLYFDTTTQFLFDAHQSTFLYVLCKPFVPASFLDPQWQKNDLLRKHDWSPYDIDCNQAMGMNECYMSFHLVTMFNTIINDYVDSKIASIYGVNKREEGKIEKAGIGENDNDPRSNSSLANDFSKFYFSGTVLCDPKDKNKNACLYPKTHKHLKQFISKGKGMIRSTKVINASNILLTKAPQCSLPSSIDTPYNMLRCGLFGDTAPEGRSSMEGGNQRGVDQPTLNNFSNLLYNELFWFQLLNTYYAQELIDNPSLQTFSMTSNINQVYQQGQSDAVRINQDSKRITKAIAQSVERIAHIHNKFPIHIGLMIYIEGLGDLRHGLAKIYTPLHQLYYKLRNVQQSA